MRSEANLLCDSSLYVPAQKTTPIVPLKDYGVLRDNNSTINHPGPSNQDGPSLAQSQLMAAQRVWL
jgi:hypothetical protein